MKERKNGGREKERKSYKLSRPHWVKRTGRHTYQYRFFCRIIAEFHTYLYLTSVRWCNQFKLLKGIVCPKILK